MWAVQGLCARRSEIPTCGRPPGSTSGCCPPLRMTQKAEGSPKVWICTGLAGFSALFLRLDFTLGFRRYFLASKLIKKPSPVGEGGPRQWWMRSPREKLTYTRHLIRQPAAATFSHWRRLSFVSALFANKYKSVFSNTYPPKKVSCTTPRHPTFRPYVSS